MNLQRLRQSSGRTVGLVLLAATLTASPLFAHTGVGSTSGFVAGLVHPFSGLDHLLAMIAVGFWAAQQRGRALWVLPLAFVTVMTAGGVLGMLGLALPFAERGVVLSLLVFGTLVAAAVRLPLVLGMFVVGLFAFCHGHTHGSEMPVSAAGSFYAIGFITATSVLHGLGIALAFCLGRLTPARGQTVVRLAGVSIAFMGLVLWVS